MRYFFGFLEFPNWHWFISKLALVYLFVFFWVFGIAFGQNLKLETVFGLFWFFGIGFGQNSKLETVFWVFFCLFCFFVF